MLKLSFVVLQIAVIGLCSRRAYCFTEEEESALLQALQPVVMECIEACGFTEDDLKNKNDADIDPCIKKCFLKKIGLLNDEGNYERDAVRDQVLTYTDNEAEADKIQGVLDDCFKDKEDDLKNDKDAESKRVDIIFDCLKKFKE